MTAGPSVPPLQGQLPEAGAKPLGEEEEEDITAQLPDVPTAEPATQGM